MWKYLSMYTHTNTLVYESQGTGTERILAYAATDIAEQLVQQTGQTFFPGVVQYNGVRVSVLVLPNGYRLFGVFEAGVHEKEHLERAAGKAVSLVLGHAYDERGEFSLEKILKHGALS
ncbi:hypothetical protein NECID01_1999 [Nematocida sp. AWRm77]|nr:hypothetical protein NECID01_1999 [Nematocida sp. AWRm77]